MPAFRGEKSWCGEMGRPPGLWASRRKGGKAGTGPLEVEVYQQDEQQVSGGHGSGASEGTDELSWQRRSEHQRVPRREES